MSTKWLQVHTALFLGGHRSKKLGNPGLIQQPCNYFYLHDGYDSQCLFKGVDSTLLSFWRLYFAVLLTISLSLLRRTNKVVNTKKLQHHKLQPQKLALS